MGEVSGKYFEGLKVDFLTYLSRYADTEEGRFHIGDIAGYGLKSGFFRSLSNPDIAAGDFSRICLDEVFKALLKEGLIEELGEGNFRVRKERLERSVDG